ncbi:sensor histidine kinase [Romboutsia sp.]|uniref:sensor histidine kinase n=1 Tax=Romboutsia sp. TaxID=1965302 RepID=UPI003F2F369D
MYKFKKNYQEISNRQNKIASTVILIISGFFVISYMIVLILSLNPNKSNTNEITLFIKLFSVMLSGLAVASCILCYMSTNKEEIFIISLMYIVFFIDILMGNFDNLQLTNSVIDTSTYITVLTSLIRISILMILILPLENIKKLIINNKLKSSVIILILSILIGTLRTQNILLTGLNTIEQFKAYNLFLVVVYLIFTTRFIIKGIKQRDAIYLVISVSILFFAIKALYAIAGVTNPSVNIKLVSLSITYMGFLVLIAGLFTELAFSIKKNKCLENEIQMFYNLVDDSKYSCIAIYDENLNIKYSNKTIKTYLFNRIKVSDSEVDKKINEYISELKEEFIEEILKSVKEKGAWEGNIIIDSEDITLNCFVQEIYTYDNKRNTVVNFSDVSHRIRAEKSLIEYEKMKNHENIKNEFFSNISHELKTPLNIFYSTIQLLDLKSKDTSVNFNEVYFNHKQCLKINCQRMLRLINNIVDITKIDVGFTKPKFVNCDIIRLVEEITLSVINYANPKDITITFDTEVEELSIKCDPSMIERVMLNLLSNAIKFTKPNGNILVSMYNDEEWVHIRVKDDGIGIPVEMQGIIFERFIQGDKSLTRLNEGSGIGLSIVKSIVELNKGEIYLDSDGESGTEFEILLPNKVLQGYEEAPEVLYEIDIQKIELELSDIYKLYE